MACRNQKVGIIMSQKIVYNHKAVEKKWREKWEENPVNIHKLG